MKKLLVVGLMMSSFVFGQNKEKDSLIDRSSDKGSIGFKKEAGTFKQKRSDVRFLWMEQSSIQ